MTKITTTRTLLGPGVDIPEDTKKALADLNAKKLPFHEYKKRIEELFKLSVPRSGKVFS
jgi:hypothetical protein